MRLLVSPPSSAISSPSHPISLFSTLTDPPFRTGVHGLRGVTAASSKGGETDFDSASILETDAASSVGGSRTTSRRGSEAKNDAGGFGVSELAAQLKQGLGLDDVVEGQAVE